MKTICLICNITICNKYYLKKHLLKFHNITIEEYNIKHKLAEPVIDRRCKYCGEDINHRHYKAEFCNKKCRKLFYNQEDNEKRAKDINNTLECKICGYKTSGSMVNHLRHRHNLTVNEYKEKYNASHEECYSEYYLNTLSEKIKGDKNPAYQHGGKFSPFSTKFIKYENVDNKEYEIYKIKEKANISRDKNSSHTTRLDYWLKQDLSQEAAEQELSNRQTTFSLNKCIEKYGIELGTQKWQLRQDKWMNTLDSKPEEEKAIINKKKILNSNGSVSKTERNLYEKLKTHNTSLEQQLMLSGDSRKFLYDIADTSSNKIIEYNGDYWHCNPKKYSANYYHTKLKMTANEIWERDAHKIKIAIQQGYEILVVWEMDYKNDKENILNKCINFLEGN